MKHPDTLAALRLAFSRGEIDGVTYKTLRRTLVASIASGALPPSPLTPFTPVAAATTPQPSDDIPPEQLQTRVLPSSLARNTETDLTERAPASPPPRVAAATDAPRPPPTRNSKPLLVVAGLFSAGVVAALLWLRSPDPHESQQATSVSTNTSPGAQALDISAEALVLENFVSNNDWSSASVDGAARALTTLNSAERDSLAGRGLIARLTHMVSLRIDQEREIIRSGSPDMAAIASLVALGRAVNIDTRQIDSLQADASASRQDPALPAAVETKVAAADTMSPLAPPAVAPEVTAASEVAHRELGEVREIAPKQEVANTENRPAPDPLRLPENPLSDASPLPSPERTPQAPVPGLDKPKETGRDPLPVPQAQPALVAAAESTKPATVVPANERRPAPIAELPPTTAAIPPSIPPVASKLSVKPKNTTRACSAVDVTKVWKAATERTVSCQDKLADGTAGPIMIAIPAGSFVMGGHLSFERPIHNVKISKPLAVGRYEVTQTEYARYATAVNQQAPQDSTQPMVNVTWHDASSYATWLSQQTGAVYRLPTEAEWEYFARAGATTRYPAGDVTPDPLIVGNFTQTPPKTPKSGRSGSVNKFFLWNTLGNVREWVQDAWREGYDGASGDGDAVSGSGLRVVRGGSFRDNALGLRLGSRSRMEEGTRDDATGFRVVRELGN